MDNILSLVTTVKKALTGKGKNADADNFKFSSQIKPVIPSFSPLFLF